MSLQFCSIATNLKVLHRQGGKIRGNLVAELQGKEGVVIEEGTAGANGKQAAQNGMRRLIVIKNFINSLSKYCWD